MAEHTVKQRLIQILAASAAQATSNNPSAPTTPFMLRQSFGDVNPGFLHLTHDDMEVATWLYHDLLHRMQDTGETADMALAVVTTDEWIIDDQDDDQ